MKKHSLIVILLVFGISMMTAQVSSKYLNDAVAEVDGRVVFTRNIPIDSNITQEKLFEALQQWATIKYKATDEHPNRSILLIHDEGKYIVCQGDDFLIFKTSSLSLDRATMYYQLILRATDNLCTLELVRIRYKHQDYEAPQPAEKMITDKVALHKDGTKLNRHYDKYRIFTIDRVDEIAENLSAYFRQKGLLNNVATSTTQRIDALALASNDIISTSPASVLEMEGYRKLDADKVPGNIIRMLKDDWALLTSGVGENINTMTISWGGLGRFWEKPVATCYLNPTRHSINTMDAGDTYTISFYTEMYRDALKYAGSTSGKDTDKIKGSNLTPIKTPAGAPAFSEAWLILECKKILAQPISEDAIADKATAKKWNKDGYHKIYIGEIVNVWVK